MSEKLVKDEQTARQIKSFWEGEHGMASYIEGRLGDLSRQILEQDDREKRDALWIEAKCLRDMKQHYSRLLQNGVIASANIAAERQRQESD